jgi:hypothetical protein
MSFRRLASVLLATALVLVISGAASAQLVNSATTACNPRLEELLLNKRFAAKIQFPASSDGIDLTLNGEWNPKDASRAIKNRGLGIDIDDPVTVNQVKLKGSLLEVQMNGGGFGTFGDQLFSSNRQKQDRASGAKASGGSRINLRFTRTITCDELADPEKMMGFLSPLLDVSSLKIAAAQKSMSPEWAEAAAQKKVLVGMDKTTVFAILGEPKQKQVDLNAEPPTEKWQYDMADMKTRVVTFTEGKVSKVVDF